MTSSLVGSEMCIRDSLIITPAYATAYGDPQTLYYSFHGGADLIITSYEPVSYTHLTLPTICSV
eukprot:2885961-Prorocentrum_lima.AAC.1